MASYCQAGEMLGSWTIAKREKCWVLGQPPSGHISTVEKIAERTKRNPSPACGRGVGVRAFVRRTNLVKRNRQAFFALLRRYAIPPPASGRRDYPLFSKRFSHTARWVDTYSQAGQILGSWAVAKREKCWVPRLPPSGTNAGFSDCRQAGQILGSRTAAKRDKCWGLGLPSSEGITVCLSPAKRRCSAVFCFCPAVFNRR